MSTASASLRRHARFLAACGAGLAAGLAGWPLLGPVTALLVGADTVFAVYLMLALHLATTTGPADLRRRAAASDEGPALIVTLAAAAVATGFTGATLVLNGQGPGPAQTALALAAVPLGWAMVQVLAAFHYAHEYYEPAPAGGDRGGLAFPGDDLPGPSDFLYVATGIGMTAQVSDVVVTDRALRRAVMVHALASFAFNAVIVALAVNAVAVLAG